MLSSTPLITLVALITSLSPSVSAQSKSTDPNAGITILASKRYEYPNLPYKVDTATGGDRGAQFGYNICNSTTENQGSLCQTSFINSVDDFCLWTPPDPNSVVGDVEGSMVAWCTKPGKGTRMIPPGAITGLQFMRTPHYSQVVGFFDQTQLNIAEGDTGGEMDPHGADQRGNPLGGLVFSSQFGAGNSSDFKQVIQWHLFVGANTFCFKACDPSYELGYRMCEHIYDRIGCAFNAPASYSTINGTFQSCQGDDQLPPGIYVENGVTSTYTQPAESLGPISVTPYVPFTPASSSCTMYSSNVLFSANTLTTTAPSSSATTTTTSVSSTSSGQTTTPTPTSAPIYSSRSASGTSATASSTSRTGGATNLKKSAGGVAVVLAFMLAVVVV